MSALIGSAVLDLQAQVRDGELFLPPDDKGRVDAFIPSLGDEDHAPNLTLLPSGDLLCVWFAGSAEGYGDIRIGLSRLPAGAAAWEAPRFVTTSLDRSEQNPSLFLTPAGELWLLYTSQETRGMTREHGTRAASRASSPCSGRRRSGAGSRSTRAARGARRTCSSTRRARSAGTRRRCSRTVAGCSPCTTRSRPAAGTATTTASCACRTTARRGRSIRCPARRAACTRPWWRPTTASRCSSAAARPTASTSAARPTA